MRLTAWLLAPLLASSQQAEAPIVLTNAIGDSILFSKYNYGDSLRDYSESSDQILRDSTSSWKIALANGDTLRLDDRTPNGEYRTGDGRFFAFNSPQKYPRRYSSGSKWKVLSFSLRSSRRLAIIMLPESMGPLTNRVRDSLITSHLPRVSAPPRIRKDGDV